MKMLKINNIAQKHKIKYPTIIPPSTPLRTSKTPLESSPEGFFFFISSGPG